MRRLNCRNSLKQRLNEILGNDYDEVSPGIPGITPWSIQAAMITNLQRIVSAIMGNIDSGRPMRGMWITQYSNMTISISKGYGFTANGGVVVLESGIDYSLVADGTYYIYLKHEMAVLDGDLNSGGKKTGFIGKEGTEDIVYDDKAAAKGNNVGSISTEIIESFTSKVNNPDYIYLGSVTVAASTITDISCSTDRGLGIAPDGWHHEYNLKTVVDIWCGRNIKVDGYLSVDEIKSVTGTVDITDEVEFHDIVSFANNKSVSLPSDASKLTVGGTAGVSGSFVDAGGKTITVTNGIITAIVGP